MNDIQIAPLVQGDRDQPFWDGWADGERFLLHRCSICDRHEWPATCCIGHGLAPMEWVETEGAGTIDTFTIFHHAYSKELADQVPYTVAVVRLDEGPYFHTRLVDIAPEQVRTGLRVRLRRGAGDAFPLFIPERALEKSVHGSGGGIQSIPPTAPSLFRLCSC